MIHFGFGSKTRHYALTVKVLCNTLLTSLMACTEPIAPQFEFESGLIYVDGFISDIPGSSFVSVSESNFLFDIFKNEFIENAEVVLRNTNNGLEVTLTEEDEVYLPPIDFAVQPGESWELNILLEDGRQYRSLPETVNNAVPILKVDAAYDPELLFDLGEDDFVPGHSIAVTFNDPPQEDNFYLWRFRSFEKLVVCASCPGGVYRDDRCISFAAFNAQCGSCLNESEAQPQYTYTCETDCWQIRFNENIEIFSDEFINGISGNRLSIADVVLYTNNDILVEVQQYALSAEGHRYFKTLQDIVDNNGNFNAPPPATLLGNMFNANDDDEFVLGRFTVALASTATIFIDRSDIEEMPLEQIQINGESDELFFGNALLVKTTTSCDEGRFRTGIQPEGWIDN